MNNRHIHSIRLMPGGFCFSIDKDEYAGEASELKFVNVVPGPDYESRLQEAILDLGIDAGDDEIIFYVETSRMSLSPSAFEESLAEDMFCQTLRATEADEIILHEITHSGDVRVSFGIDKAFYNFLIRTYQYVIMHHPIVEMIDDDALRIHNSKNWMVARVTQTSLFIIAYKDGALQVANCFETMSVNNRAYHVLNTWTMLGMDVLLDTLYIIGINDDVNKLRSEVSNFIKLCE